MATCVSGKIARAMFSGVSGIGSGILRVTGRPRLRFLLTLGLSKQPLADSHESA